MSGFGKRPPGDSPLEFRPQLKTAAPAVDLSKGPVFPLIAAGVVLLAGVLAWNLFPSRSAAASPAAIALEQHLEAHPGLERLHAVLEAHYPAQHRQIAGASLKALKRGDMHEPTRLGHRAFMPLVAGQMEHVRRADGATLQAWARSTSTMLAEIQAVSPDTCAQPHKALATLSVEDHPDVADAVNAFGAATLNAIHIGKTAPRKHDAYTPQDDHTFGMAMVNRGISREEIAKGEDAWKGLSGEKHCSLLVKVFQSMESLPEPGRSRILAHMATAALGPL